MKTAFRKSFLRDIKRLGKDEKLLGRIRDIILEVEAAGEIQAIANLSFPPIFSIGFWVGQRADTQVCPYGSGDKSTQGEWIGNVEFWPVQRMGPRIRNQARLYNLARSCRGGPMCPPFRCHIR